VTAILQKAVRLGPALVYATLDRRGVLAEYCIKAS